MATYTYTKVSAFVAYQLFGFGDANELKESIDYLETDIFGNPSGNSDGVTALTIASGKKFYMSDGTTNQMYHSGSDFNVVGDANSAGTTKIRGQRQWLMATSQGAALSADDYLVGGSGYNGQFLMPYAGSMTAYSIGIYTATYSSSGTARLQVFKNGSSWVNGSSMSVSAGSTRYQDYATASRGTNTFAAGDRIGLYYDLISGTYTVYAAALIEVVFDE